MKKLLLVLSVVVLVSTVTVALVCAHKKKPDDPIKPKPPIHKPREQGMDVENDLYKECTRVVGLVQEIK